MSGKEMVATFWPTVGTVLPAVVEGSLSLDAEAKRALTWERKVVLPALSRPRSKMEYSVMISEESQVQNSLLILYLAYL